MIGPSRIVAALLAVTAGCSGDDGFSGFDSGIPPDGGVWGEGETLTCAHDPLPAFDTLRWDLADNFPSRVSIGANYVVPPGAEAVWVLSGAEDGVLSATGGGDLVGQAIRTSAAMGLTGRQTVAWVDVVPTDFSVDSPSLFCRMEDANPPTYHYGLSLLADRAVLVENGEEKEEIPYEALVMGSRYRMILGCHDRSNDTLLTAFLYHMEAGGFVLTGCVQSFDRTPRAAGTVALGLRAGTADFDNVRVYMQ